MLPQLECSRPGSPAMPGTNTKLYTSTNFMLTLKNLPHYYWLVFCDRVVRGEGGGGLSVAISYTGIQTLHIGHWYIANSACLTC